MTTFYRVLLIDDEPMTNRIQSEMIHAADFAGEIAVCRNGREALAYLDRALEEGTWPEVIFLDINMPEMNGWEFLDAFRLRAYKDKPFIFLQSATQNEADKKRVETYPEIIEFIKKPVNIEVLERLKERLRE